ncbi:MAG: adenylate/guanylate cyclase domain-containing protein [bacterium]
MKNLRRKITALMPTYYPIAYKLAFVLTLLMCSGMALLGAFIAHNQSQVLEQQIMESGNTVLRQMADFAREPLLANDEIAMDIIVSNLVSERAILGAALYNEKRLPIVIKGVVPVDEEIANTLGDVTTQEWQQIMQDGKKASMASFSRPIVFKDITAGYALITFDGHLRQVAQQNAIRTVIGVTILLVIVGIIASFILGEWLTRPIYLLIKAGQAISAGDYGVRFVERRRDELGLLMHSMNEMSEGLLKKEQVEQAFSRYVSPMVAKTVLGDMSQIELGGQHVDASVLFADIVGFTQLSENMDPEKVNSLLNEYFGIISEAAQGFGGYVDKYIGDCAMLVFGIPQYDPQHSFQAAVCAITIQRLVGELNIQREQQGKQQVEFRIGINSGRMLAGNMGAAERMDYTVVGDTVNTASRIASGAGPGTTLVSDEVNSTLRARGIITAQFKTLSLRGKKTPVPTYRVLDVSEKDQPMIEDILNSILNSKKSVT